MKIFVTVKPNARQIKVEVVSPNTLRMAVTEPPVDGRANRAVIRLLASHFDCAPSEVQLVQGTTAKIKLFEIPDC